MGQVLHACARTTEAVRLAIQGGAESVRVLAARYGVRPTTIQWWRKQDHVHDTAMGPKKVRSFVLTLEVEIAEQVKAAVVAFRRHTLLPLDDCLYAMQLSLQHLTRSSLHRCLQRHGISRLPEIKDDKPGKRVLSALAPVTDLVAAGGVT